MNDFFLIERVVDYCNQLRTESTDVVTSYRDLQAAGIKIAYKPRLRPSGEIVISGRDNQREMEINECGIYLPPRIRGVTLSDYDLIDIETNEPIESVMSCVVVYDLTDNAKAFFALLREEDNPDLYDFPFLDMRGRR